MYTNRRTFVMKRGHFREVIELFKTAPNPPDRIYGGNAIASGHFDKLIVEWDFESLAEYEANMTARLESPEFWPWQNKLTPLTEVGGHNEILYRHK